jgi:hypothetical protein
MSALLVLLSLAGLFAVVLLFSILRISGACSAAEQWQADKKLFDKWRQDHDRMS